MTITRSLHFAVIGQSYGREGFNDGPAYHAFCSAIRAVFATDAATINSNTGLSVASGDCLQKRGLAVDGTAILEANAGSSGYWVANDLATPGAKLSDATTAIGGYATKPFLVLHSHGEQDATTVASSAAAANVGTALTAVLWPQIRSAINAGTPTNVPVWVDVLGPRFSASELKEYWIRDAMLTAIAGQTKIFKGCEKYALQLDATTHPTPTGYRQMGAHTGRKVAHWLVNQVNLNGPTITSPTRSTNNVTVTISVPTGKTLVKPTEPDFFGLFDASDNPIAITGYSWNGNNLTLLGASQPAKLRYPVPTGKSAVDITRIIRLSNPSSVDRLYVGEPGLVLESMITHEF